MAAANIGSIMYLADGLALRFGGEGSAIAQVFTVEVKLLAMASPLVKMASNTRRRNFHALSRYLGRCLASHNLSTGRYSGAIRRGPKPCGWHSGDDARCHYWERA